MYPTCILSLLHCRTSVVRCSPFMYPSDVHILSPMKEVPLASHQLWRWMLEVGAGSRHQGCLKSWGSSGTWDTSAQSPVAACLFNPSLHKLKSRSIKHKADPSFGKVTSPSQRAKPFLLCRAINTRLGAASTLGGEGSSGSPLHISPRELLTAAVGAGVSDSAGRAVPSAIWSRAAHKAALFSDVRISICIMKQVIGALPIHAAAIGGDSEMRGRVMSNWPQLIWWEFFFNILSVTEWILQKSTSALIYLPDVGPVYTVKCLPIALKAVSQTQQALATKRLFFIRRSTFTLLKKKTQINPLLNNIMSWQNLVQGWVCGCSASPLCSFFLHCVRPRWPVCFLSQEAPQLWPIKLRATNSAPLLAASPKELKPMLDTLSSLNLPKSKCQAYGI